LLGVLCTSGFDCRELILRAHRMAMDARAKTAQEKRE
jgi:hypothetical protein